MLDADRDNEYTVKREVSRQTLSQFHATGQFCVRKFVQFF